MPNQSTRGRRAADSGRIPLLAFRAIVTVVMSAWVELDADQKAVLVALACHVDRDLECFPSVPLLLVETGLTKHRYYDAVSALEAGGWITRTPRKHQSSILSLVPLLERMLNAPESVLPEAAISVLSQLLHRSTLRADAGLEVSGIGESSRASRFPPAGIETESRFRDDSNPSDTEGSSSSKKISKGNHSPSARDLFARDPLASGAHVLNLDGTAHVPVVDPVDRVFECWRTVHGKHASKLTANRRKLIAKTLKAGYTVEECEAAIRGIRNRPFFMGGNGTGEVLNDLRFILAPTRIDEFIDADRTGPPKPAGKAERRTHANLEAGAEAKRQLFGGGQP